MLWSGKLEARWTEIITEGEVNTIAYYLLSLLLTVTKQIPHSLRDPPQAFETNYTLLLTVDGGPNRRCVENVSLGNFPGLGKGGLRQHTFHKLTMGRLYTVCDYSNHTNIHILNTYLWS